MEIQQENKAAAQLNPGTSKASLEEILKNTMK
jgi:hypothetical protein